MAQAKVEKMVKQLVTSLMIEMKVRETNKG